MKIIIASTPATGHLNPLLAIGQILVDEGHEVLGVSARAMRGRIERIGAAFRPFLSEADHDLSDIDAVFPERKAIPPGLDSLRFDMERMFIDPMPAQHETLLSIMEDFPADLIIADNLMLGTLPMLLGPRSGRPAVILCGTTFLLSRRDDGAPPFAGLPPATTEAQLANNAAVAQERNRIIDQPLVRRIDRLLGEMGIRPMPMIMFDAVVELPDVYLQLTAPGFEFPRRDLPAPVEFIGALPIIPNQAPLPSWAHELDGSRKVVLVTQGTIANHDFGHLVAPTLAALADQPDLLVVVTCGGRPVEAVPGPIPANARLAQYLPFEWLLPKVDAFVTNGGYGSVNQALSFGIPLVAAGMTEDKADVNARVAWSGVGIDLATNEPTVAMLHEAIRAVLDQPAYKARAAALGDQFRGIDTRSEILRIVEQTCRRHAESIMQPA